MVYWIEVKSGRYPDYKFLDGDITNVDLAGPETKEKTIIKIINRRFLQLTGLPVVLPNPPTTLRWGSVKSIHDYYRLDWFSAVCEKMKDIIEDLEPGVHQFWPLQLIDKKKQPIAKRWLWNVCNRIDSVDRKHTTYIQRQGGSWSHPNGVEDADLPPAYDRSAEARLVFSTARIGGAHFWRDPNLQAKRLYCSNAAGAALQAKKFDRLDLRQFESV